MAFAQLFSSLSAVQEDVRSARQPAVTLSSDTDGGGGGRRGRKRKTPCELIGSSRKKPCAPIQRTPTPNNIKDNNTKTTECHAQNTDGERGLNGFSGRGRKSQRQQLKKKLDGQKDPHQDKDRGRSASGNRRTVSRRGGRGGKHNGDRQDSQMKPRFMTQEFKDQNALLVDGRLLCRHFLRGRCIKADECQLEHIQGYNDLLKEVCKFYVQGFCAKGNSCPYMHESFPCKFFHRKRKCSQKEDCRFSHEPLTDVTEKLLDEALKRESDLYELARKAEQESSGQPAKKEEPEVMEPNGTLIVLEELVRPNFYNSTEASTETETSLHQTEETPTITDEAAPPRASDTAQPHSPSSTSISHPEPVCYSVEAVLGHQLYRPFPSFCNSPKSKDSTSLTVPETTFKATSGSMTQNEVPYSVDAVLGSFRSVENSATDQRPAPPSMNTKEIPDPVLRPQHQLKKVSLITRQEPNKSQGKVYKSLPSVQVNTSLISRSDLSCSSGNQKQHGDIPESLKTAPTAFHQVKLERLHPPVNVENFPSSKSKVDVKESTQLPADNARPHEHPTQVKPHPSVGVTEVKSRTAAPVEPAANSTETSDAANFAGHHFAAKQLAEISQYPRKTQSVLKAGAQKPCSTKMSPQCSGETATRGHFTGGCKKTQKIPFNCLFANPVTESVRPAPDSVRTVQSADFTREERRVKTEAAPVKTSATPFLSLFATALTETLSTPSCSQVSAENTFHLATERVSNLVLTPLCQVQTDVKQTSHSPASLKCSTTSKTEPDPAAHPADPSSSIVQDSLKETPFGPVPRGPSPPKSPAQEQLPDGSTPRRASKNSVLKSLFLNLSPYHEDGEQPDRIEISARPESRTNNKDSVGSVFGKRHEQKKHRTSSGQSAVKAAAHSEDRPSFQTPQNSSEVTGGPALGSPGVTEPQVRNSGMPNFPPESATRQISRDTEPRAAHTSGVEKRGREYGSDATEGPF